MNLEILNYNEYFEVIFVFKKKQIIFATINLFVLILVEFKCRANDFCAMFS